MCEGEYSIVQEYTVPHTPQHSGAVEHMFAHNAQRALAMMLSAELITTMQSKLWTEATKTAAMLGNAMSDTRSAIPPDEILRQTRHYLSKSHQIWARWVPYKSPRNDNDTPELIARSDPISDTSGAGRMDDNVGYTGNDAAVPVDTNLEK
jgi:hypothetical protein